MSSNKTQTKTTIHHLLQPHNPCLKQLPVHIAWWPCNHFLSNWKISKIWICHLRPTNLKNLGRTKMQKTMYDVVVFFEGWNMSYLLVPVKLEFNKKCLIIEVDWNKLFFSWDTGTCKSLYMFTWKNTASCHCGMCKQCRQCKKHFRLPIDWWFTLAERHQIRGMSP